MYAAHPPSSRVPTFAALVMVLSACGESPPPADKTPQVQVQDKPATSSAPVEAAAPKEPFPTACSKEGGDMCVPPTSFARRVCSANSPAMALALFAKGTPWVRGYMARTTEAWDASGGPSSSDKLLFDEEVLILVRRVPKTGGMVVSGASGGGYDVLRWNGKCASLEAEEVRTRLPPAPGHAEISWRKLDDAVQELLEKDQKIAGLVADQKRECKGVSAGQTNPKCEKAQKSVSKAIVAYVRRGDALPPPPELP